MDLSFCCQACINSYKGRYGDPLAIFDREEDFRVDYAEGTFGEHSDGSLYVVFPGSIELNDWISNFRFSRHSYEEIYCSGSGVVHKGFVAHYHLIRDIVYEKAKNYKKIHVTGFSMGGALATLCALDLRHQFVCDIDSVTFGSPRVGDKAFVEYYNDVIPETKRVVNGDDLVTKLPMTWLGYSHVGQEVQIGVKKWHRWFGSILDHVPQKYLDNILQMK